MLFIPSQRWEKMISSMGFVFPRLFDQIRPRNSVYNPSEAVQREIIRSFATQICLEPPCRITFEAKIVSIRDFLPEKLFRNLREVARRQVQTDRVHIPAHKRGATISYHDLHHCAPEIIAFYLSPELHAWSSAVIGERVQPTPLNDLSSCSLLIYDQPHDHIGWHYDIDFYRGRHFTALLSLVNTNAEGTGVSSANLVVLRGRQEAVIPTPPNTLVLFEGADVYHSVTPLREGERRVILSMTFCTDPSASTLQTLERRVKDIAYFGLRALWT
jgi:2OG-Fe(II) oxygenase superfamily